jgi:hypothetical protein
VVFTCEIINPTGTRYLLKTQRVWLRVQISTRGVWVRVQISTCSLFTDGWVIALPDSNPTRCHPYFQIGIPRPNCRSGFTTLPPVTLLEQYRCGSFIGGAQIARGVGYPGIRWTRRFTWFGPPERNTLRPRAKGVILLCLSARLRSSLFSPSMRASV